MPLCVVLIALVAPPTTSEGWLESLRIADEAFFASGTLTVRRSKTYDPQYPEMGKQVDELRHTWGPLGKFAAMEAIRFDDHVWIDPEAASLRRYRDLLGSDDLLFSHHTLLLSEDSQSAARTLAYSRVLRSSKEEPEPVAVTGDLAKLLFHGEGDRSLMWYVRWANLGVGRGFSSHLHSVHSAKPLGRFLYRLECSGKLSPDDKRLHRWTLTVDTSRDFLVTEAALRRVRGFEVRDPCVRIAGIAHARLSVLASSTLSLGSGLVHHYTTIDASTEFDGSIKERVDTQWNEAVALGARPTQ